MDPARGKVADIMQYRASRLLRWWLAPVIIVALVIAAVELMSWNFLKPIISERVEKATGHSVAIHGDVEISLFPLPQLLLNELVLDNPEWAASPHMLEARRVSVSPSLSDLLQGEVVLEDIGFFGSTLNLEQRADAPGSWVFGDEQAHRQAQTDGDTASPLAIRNLSLSDSQVRYWAAEAETPLEVSVSSLQMQANDETLHTQATLTYQQRRFELEADTDPIAAFIGDAQAFGGEFSLSSSESLLTSTFAFSQAPSLARLQANMELSLDNVAEWSQWLGLPQVRLDSLEIAASMERQGSEWRLHDIDAAVADSQLTGELAMDIANKTLRLDGWLHSSQIVVAALPKFEQQTGLPMPALPDLRGEIVLSVGRLRFEQALLKNIQAKVQLAEHSVALSPLTFDMADGDIEAEVNVTSSPERVAAEAQVALQNLDMAELNSALPSGDTLNADLTLELQSLEQRPTFEFNTLIDHLLIKKARLAYRDAEAGSDLEAILETTDEGESSALLLNVSGSFRDKPLALQVRGGPLSNLVALENGSLKQDYPFEAEVRSNGVFAQADTTLASLLAPQTFEAEVVLNADSGQALEAWIGPVLPLLPEFRLAGRLSRDHEQWSATGLEGEIGSTNVSGNVDVLSTERPVVEIDLKAGRVDLAQLISATTQESDEEVQSDFLLAPLRRFDGQLALRADSLVLPDGTVLQGLVLSASLDAGRLDVDPLRFGLADGSITGRLVLDATGQMASGRLDAVIDDMALAGLVDTFTPVEDRLGRLSADLHLEMRDTLSIDSRNDLLLPFIGRMRLEPSTLRFEAPEADTELTLRLATRDGETGGRRFYLEGEGRYDGHPATLSLVGDSLLDARDLDRPYAVNLEAEVVGSRIALQGPLVRPLAVQGQNLEFTLEGPNPQRLSRLLGVALPNLPPYSVSGNLELNEQRWKLDNMKGEIGGSDLDGWLSLETRPSPPRLTGELRSDSLDIADLGVIFGATQESEDRFILPDAPFVGEGWHTVTADVSYRGESVRAGNVPLSNVDIDFRLEDGHGRFDPVSFGIGEGNIDLVLDLDAGSWPPVGTMQVEIRRVDLNDVLRHWNLANESAGIAGGRGKFWVEGRSVAQLLASADGGMLLLMTGGRLDAVPVELAGLDAFQAIFSWLRGREPIPIDCVYADLQARSGVAKLDTFVVDTQDTTFTAGGEVDLNTERLDISIFAHPKDPSVFTGRAPFHLGGTFNDIELGVHSGGLGLGMRAGASAVLGALGGPIAALLPLLVVGTDPDMAYCEGLVSRSQEAIRDEGGGP